MSVLKPVFFLTITLPLLISLPFACQNMCLYLSPYVRLSVSAASNCIILRSTIDYGLSVIPSGVPDAAHCAFDWFKTLPVARGLNGHLSVILGVRKSSVQPQRSVTRSLAPLNPSNKLCRPIRQIERKLETVSCRTEAVLPVCRWTYGSLKTISQLTVGQWVMGQMGQHIWMGHMGHGSVSVTHVTHEWIYNRNYFYCPA